MKRLKRACYIAGLLTFIAFVVLVGWIGFLAWIVWAGLRIGWDVGDRIAETADQHRRRQAS